MSNPQFHYEPNADGRFDCWACMAITPISIEFVARCNKASHYRLCEPHQVEVAAVLLRWDS